MSSVYNGRGGRRNAPKLSDMCDSPVVVWFDPGGTTGYSVIQVHPEALVDPEVKVLDNIEHFAQDQIDCGSQRGMDVVRDIFDGEGRLEYNELAVNLAGEMEGVHDMLEVVDHFPGACVGLEDFILRSNSKGRELLSPVRIISAMDYGMFLRGFQTFRQQASEAKSTATDARLKDWGLYKADGFVHARDATRHAITWLRKAKLRKNLRAACWPHLYGKYYKLIPGTTRYKQVYGPYYIPKGQTWADVQSMEYPDDVSA